MGASLKCCQPRPVPILPEIQETSRNQDSTLSMARNNDSFSPPKKKESFKESENSDSEDFHGPKPKKVFIKRDLVTAMSKLPGGLPMIYITTKTPKPTRSSIFNEDSKI